MGQRIVIEKMKMDDIPDVSRVEEQSFPLPWSQNAYVSELSNRSAYYIVARINGILVGYTGMWVIMDEAHITTLAVDPVYRRRKIAEQLLIALIEEAMTRGARRMTLEVRKSNAAAQNLYHRYSFFAAGVRKGYYTDNNEDAIIMWTEDLWTSRFRDVFKAHRETLERETAGQDQAPGSQMTAPE